ncbi:unnamed protein product, partial [Prorocentrum cordatum]
MSQMLPPEPPRAEWSRMVAAAARTTNASLTGRLDEFLARRANAPKTSLLCVYYTELPDHHNLSQLLQAQLAYLFFQGDQCPIMYCSRDGDWWVWDQTWRVVKLSLTRVKAIFQARFLPVFQEVAGRCRAEKCFGEGEDGNPHPEQQLLDKTAAALEWQQGVEKIIRESAMLFDGEATFDKDPLLFQLSSCVVDLRSNTIRPGRPADATCPRSPIRVPQRIVMFGDRWLQNSDLVESESADDRQRSWSILRSLYKREGDRRPDDGAEELGGAGAENFPRMMHLQARPLEGAPLCKCALLWSRWGRNGKGICKKIFQAVWGEYCVPVRAAVFTADKRSEHEHNAAGAFRRGARVAFGSEVHSSAWSNAVFKCRNSTDPIAVRACNSGDTEKMKPMCMCIFACNDVPWWGQAPKGSERDRLLPMCIPNKFRDSFDAPTSPRSFLEGRGLGAEIGRPEFAIGHLLNFLTTRSSTSWSGGPSLRELAATGAMTAAHWLEAWVAEWSRLDGDGAHEGGVHAESFALARDVHARLYAPSRVRASGRLGANLVQIGAAKSRGQRMQACVAVLPFDASLCNQMFAGAAAFGDPSECARSVSFDACAAAQDELAQPAEAEVPSRRCRYTVCEVANLTALRARRDAGAAAAGERRQEWLSAHVDLLDQAGMACAFKDGVARPTSVSECPDIRVLRREYYHINDVGRACESGPGLQSCAREARVVAFEGLWAVCEFDIIAAFYQIFLEALRPHVPDGAFERDLGIVKMYADKSRECRAAVAQYFNIDVSEAKGVFSRLPFKGSI